MNKVFTIGCVCLIGAAVYSVYFYPKINIKEYQKIQKQKRANFDNENNQPSNMRVWSDPFQTRKS